MRKSSPRSSSTARASFPAAGRAACSDARACACVTGPAASRTTTSAPSLGVVSSGRTMSAWSTFRLPFTAVPDASCFAATLPETVSWRSERLLARRRSTCTVIRACGPAAVQLPSPVAIRLPPAPAAPGAVQQELVHHQPPARETRAQAPALQFDAVHDRAQRQVVGSERARQLRVAPVSRRWQRPRRASHAGASRAAPAATTRLCAGAARAACPTAARRPASASPRPRRAPAASPAGHLPCRRARCPSAARR